MNNPRSSGTGFLTSVRTTCTISLTNLRWHLCLLLYLSLGLAAHAEPVRKVDYRRTPDMEELAPRARQLGNEVYPKILVLLGVDAAKAPHHFDIVFKPRLDAQGDKSGDKLWGGLTRRLPFCTAQIYLNADWLSQHPRDIDWILVHELGHVAQDYKWRYVGVKAPHCWLEGIPEYLRFKLGYSNPDECPACSPDSPDYTSGYACAGAFLLYIDATCGSNVISQLNRELRRGSYSDKFFFKTTGKRLDELWAGFKTTSAFPPVAAEIIAFRKALGYVNNQPPKDVQARFESYLKEHSSDLRKAQRELGYEHGKPPKEVLRRYELNLFFAQPAGIATLAAREFLLDLQRHGQLPGAHAGETLEMGMPDGGYSDIYPLRRTFHCLKQADLSLYNYTVVQTTKGGPWKLERAWKTAQGRILEEFPIQNR
jgi:hypothetical protein